MKTENRLFLIKYGMIFMFHRLCCIFNEATTFNEIAIGRHHQHCSIYRDIEDINRIMLMLQEDIDLDEVDMMFEEAEESGDEEEVNELKTILYDKNKKGFYVRQRKFEVADMRLLAECVYAAKFIAEGQAKRLVNVICDFVSEEQASRIKHNAFLVDRVKTDNRGVMNNIATINDAMSRHLDGEIHTPEKITFKYLKYSVNDMSTQVERRKGARYKISPFQLLINDGNYYLLAFDDYSQEMRTYRVDRMKDIRFTGEPRDGDDEFKKIDLNIHQACLLHVRRRAAARGDPFHQSSSGCSR